MSSTSTPPIDGGPSPAYAAYLRSVRRRNLLVTSSQLGLLAIVLLLWEIAPRAGWVNPMLTSSPSAVWRTFTGFWADGTLWQHIVATLVATVIGFGGSMLIGTAVAVALWFFPLVHRALDPFMVVANALPKIALVPIFYIWLGDVASIYAVAITVSVFITVLMLITGFKAIEADKITLLRLYRATPWQIMMKIVLPGSVPTMIATLKVNAGLALVGVVVGEFQSAKAGLGYLIIYGSQIFQMNLVMTSIVLLAIISALIFAAIQLLEVVIRHRRGL
jgi:NitT/TauT family transport system permease protein